MYIIMLRKRRRSKSRNHVVYRIMYGDEIAYVGFTSQRLSAVLRRHFFGNHRQYIKVDVLKVTSILMQEHKTMADCAVYTTYYRNKFKPRLNGGQWQMDELSISLPKVRWREFNSRSMERWREQAQLIRTHQKERLAQRRKEWKQQQIRQQQIVVPKFKLKKWTED